tara:strand:+ start:1343 stop:3691 length:2349 start_codon:yes stop_codon:yes gene_type:complete
MPKQFKTYNRFEGGLNTKTNQRSIQDNELAQANNVIVDEFGVVKSAGKVKDNTTDYNSSDNLSLDASQPGYGLFQARMDYTGFSGSGTNTSTIKTFLADTDATSDTRIDIADGSGSFSEAIDLGSTANGKVIYDLADGVVRICDTNFGAGNSVKWFGYVNKKLWLDDNLSQLNVGGGSTQTVDQWVVTDAPPQQPFAGTSATGLATAVLGFEDSLEGQASGTTVTTIENITDTGNTSGVDTQLDTGLYVLASPNDTDTVGIVRRDSDTQLTIDSSKTWNAVGSDVKLYIFPDAGLGFNVQVVASGSDGSIPAGTYEFAQTFIYDGVQESLPTIMTGLTDVAANQRLTLSIAASHGYDERITGGRIYFRDSTSKGEFQLLAEVDLTYGCRTNLEAKHVGWSTIYTNASYLFCTVDIQDPNADTYSSLNGYDADLSSISIGSTGEGYKTSTVSNRRKFVANVKSVNDKGQTVIQSDRLMYSEINRFDTFPPFNFIDIGINDGEDFVKIESFADRLLAYKNKTLYVINVGGGSDTQWFLESEHANLGVEFHAAVVKTDFGIAWVNKNGLYFYDGSQIRNLQNKILESQWTSFVNDDTIIGYEPTHKHLVIVRDAAASGDTSGDAYVYSFITNNFTFVEDMVDNAVKTNIITDLHNNMTLGVGTDEIESYDGEPESRATFDIKLKDDDFGLPNITKKIYSVTVEYSTSASNSSAVKCAYIDTSGEPQTATIGNLDSTSGNYKVQNISVAPVISASSFQLQLDLNGTSISKINNVGIEYRPIRKRIT